jgi:hypothetical protein
VLANADRSGAAAAMTNTGSKQASSRGVGPHDGDIINLIMVISSRR